MIRKTLLLGLIPLLILQGCAHLPKPRPWDRTEKVMLVLSVAAVGADCYTTERFLEKGYRELNPLIGEHPTDTELVVRGGALYGVFLLIAHYIPGLRKILLMGQTTRNTGAAIGNSKLD